MFGLMNESSSDNEISSLSSDSDISANAETSTSLLVPAYVQNFINTSENVPTCVMREISKIMELDIKIQKNFVEVDNIKNHMRNAHISKEDVRENMQCVKRKLNRVLLLEEMKNVCLGVITSSIEHAASQLCEDQSKVLQVKGYDIETPSPVYSNEDGDSNIGDDGDDDDNSTYSNKKLSKRLSSNSRGRGRRSVGPRDQDEDIETLLNSSRSSTSSRRKSGRGKRRIGGKASPNIMDIDPDEPRYCLCNEVSYGEMIGCDNNNCPIEWFHFVCVNLIAKPKGKWFCPNCTKRKTT